MLSIGEREKVGICMIYVCLLTDVFFSLQCIVRWKGLSFRSVIKDYGRFFIRRCVLISFYFYFNQLEHVCRSWPRSLMDGCLLGKYRGMVRLSIFRGENIFLLSRDLVSAMKKKLEREAMEQEIDE